MKLGFIYSSTTFLNLVARGLNAIIFYIIINRFGSSAETDWFFFLTRTLAIVLGLLFFSLEYVLVPLWPSLEKEEEKKFSTAFSQLGLLITGVLLLVSIPFAYYAPSLFGFDYQPSFNVLIALSLGLFIQPGLAYFSAFYSSWFQANDRYFMPILHLNIRCLAMLPLLLFWEQITLINLVITFTFGEVARLLFLLYFYKSERSPLFEISLPNLKPFKEHIQAFQWMLLASLISSLNPIIDFIMVGNLGSGLPTLVEYTSRLRTITALAFGGILIYLLGTWSKEHGKNLSWPVIKKQIVFMAICGGGMSLFLVLTRSIWIPLLFGNKLYSEEELVIISSLSCWYLVSAFFFLLMSVLHKAFLVLRRFRFLCFMTFFGVLVNILGNIVFINYFNIVGVAMATALVDFVAFFVVLLVMVLRERKELSN